MLSTFWDSSVVISFFNFGVVGFLGTDNQIYLGTSDGTCVVRVF